MDFLYYGSKFKINFFFFFWGGGTENHKESKSKKIVGRGGDREYSTAIVKFL